MLYSILLVGIFVFSAVGQPQWYPQRGAKLYRGGESSWIYTKWDAQFDTVWYTVEDRKSIVFSVKACSSAHVALSTVAGMTDFTIDVALGVVGNFRSQIRYPFEPGSMFQAETPNILHCNEYRTFWISWSLDYIEVGRGPSVGEQKFMNWFDTTLEQFTAIGFSSSEGHAALWEVKENSGDFVVLKTPDDHKYETFWKSVPDRQFYSFEVQACGDVHVILSEELGKQDANIYEFVIGGWSNNRSVIRTEVLGGGSTIKAQVDTVSIVNCNDYREFWVSWFNGTIEMGKGGVFGKNRVMRWRDPTPNAVRYLGLTTGFGNTGSWLLNDDLGGTNVIFTPKADESSPQNKYNTSWLETPRKKFVSFGVKSCAKAMILLSDIRSPDVEMAYEVQIGYEENTKSGVRMLLEQGYLVELQTPGILNCDRPSYFWMSWVNMTVRVGRGFVYDQAELFRFDIPPDYKIAALGLATGYAGEYRFRESMGERVHVYTPTDFNHFEYFWRTVPMRYSFVFFVKAASDCHVVLNPTVGVSREDLYFDIVISGWDNTRSQIRQVRGNQRTDESEFVDTTGLLNANEFVEIWVQWIDFTVSFGTGSIPGDRTELSHQFSGFYPIAGVGLSTGFGHAGEFLVEEDNGDMITSYTDEANEDGYVRGRLWLRVYEFMTWFPFKLRTEGGGMVYIGRRNSDDGSSEIEVVLNIGMENNQKTAVTNLNGVILASADTPNIVSDVYNRPFWISWANNQIEFGRGSIHGIDTLLTYQASLSSGISLIGLDSNPSYARWMVEETIAAWGELYTNSIYNYWKIWRSVAHKQHVVFGVNACSDVHVALSQRLTFDISSYAWEVVIGGWDNTRSVIRSRDRHYADELTENILSCDGSKDFFWITWHGGAVVAGKGLIVGQNRFIDFVPVTPPDNIRFVGYTTGYEYDGTWEFPLIGSSAPSPPVTVGPPVTIPGRDEGLGAGDITGIVFGVMIAVLIAAAAALFALGKYGYLQPPQSVQNTLDSIPNPLEPKPVNEPGFGNPLESSDSLSTSAGDSSTTEDLVLNEKKKSKPEKTVESEQAAESKLTDIFGDDSFA